tara:strand:+ start:190 stop:645 length:456 start_codon:yes stop_codon:yes gene_type:complete
MALTTVKQGGIAADAVGTDALDQDAGFTLAGLNGSSTVASEGGAVNTSIQQGLIKAWFQFNSDASLQDSFNTASCTDNGTGSFTQNHTNSMANSDYAFLAMSGHDNNTLPGATITFMHKAITSGTRVRITDASGTVTDESQCNGMSAGDLA